MAAYRSLARWTSLNEQSVAAQLPLDAASGKLVQSVLDSVKQSLDGRSFTTTDKGMLYVSVQLLLVNVRITDPGKSGSYFYIIFMSLPSAAGATNAVSEVGTIRSFEVNAALQRAHSKPGLGSGKRGGAQLSFPITLSLKKLAPLGQAGVIVSFVRASGAHSASGDVIIIGEARLELSPDPVE